MKKNWGLIIVLVVVVLVLGYLGRHRIKAMLGMSSTAPPTAQTATGTPTSNILVPSNNIYTIKTDPTKGDYLADFQGMSLYTFDKDTNGVSTCTGTCATLWPYYTSGAVAQGTFPENISVITRSDVHQQFAWKGMPLYYYSKDKNPGDTLGDGIGGLWHLVKP